MDHATPVRVVQRLGNIRRDPHRVINRKLVFAVQLISEAFSLHMRHHVEDEPVSLT